MTKKLIFFIAFFMLGCSNVQTRELKPIKEYYNILPIKDTLYSFGNETFEYGSSQGFKTKEGFVMLEKGFVDMCFTDTFLTFAYVYDKSKFGEGMVAINRESQVIFEPFMFDNGPDYLSDGLMRVIRNNKIGYADKTGKIIIQPIYECAFPFVNGSAKVTFKCETTKDEIDHFSWESDTWFLIDKNGIKVKSL